MKIPIISRVIDERFLSHRRRSTSLGGIVGGIVAISLFAYHFYIDHFWSWDLFIVAVSIIVVKWAILTWYLLTD